METKNVDSSREARDRAERNFGRLEHQLTKLVESRGYRFWDLGFHYNVGEFDGFRVRYYRPPIEGHHSIQHIDVPITSSQARYIGRTTRDMVARAVEKAIEQQPVTIE